MVLLIAFTAVLVNPKGSLFTVAVVPPVDNRCVRGAVDTDGIGNFVLDILGEIANDDTFRVRKHTLKRLDERIG